MKPLYQFRKIDKEYFVFRGDDPEPFDGPMTQEEAETLTYNFNETPELEDSDDEHENPIIRELAYFNRKLEESLDSGFIYIPIPILESERGPKFANADI